MSVRLISPDGNWSQPWEFLHRGFHTVAICVQSIRIPCGMIYTTKWNHANVCHVKIDVSEWKSHDKNKFITIKIILVQFGTFNLQTILYKTVAQDLFI